MLFSIVPANPVSANVEVSEAKYAVLQVFDPGAEEMEIVDFTPDDEKVIVTNSEEENICIIDISGLEDAPPAVEKMIDLDGEPTSVAVHPSGEYALVNTLDPDAAKVNDGKTWIVDLAAQELAGAVIVGVNPDCIAISPNGKYAVVANEAEIDEDNPNNPDIVGSVSILDLTGGKDSIFVVKEVYLENHPLITGINGIDMTQIEPEFVAITPDSQYALVTVQEASLVLVIHLNGADSELTQVIELPSGSEPDGIAISANGKLAVTANEDSQGISILDLSEIDNKNIELVQQDLDILQFLPSDSNDPLYVSGEVDPEGVDVLEFNHRIHAVLTLEKGASVLILDVTDPNNVTKVDHILVTGPEKTGRPEGVKVSNDGRLIAVANEVDGTVAFIRVNPEAGAVDTVSVQLLSVNDFHGQLNVTKKVSNKPVGRADFLAAYLREREAQNENTLLVHAGDMVGASAPVSALLQDEPTVEFMNLMGFDVGTPGNHEFDEGVDEMLRLINGGAPSATENFQGANFPYVCANVLYKDSNEHVLPPYVVKTVDGIPIGFVGVALSEIPTIVIPSGVATVNFTDEADAVNDAVAELKAQGVETIIVLAHVTGYTSAGAVTGDIATLASEIDEEVDVIFAGHSHTYINGEVDGKLIVEAYSSGTAFADVDLQIDPLTRDVVTKTAEIVTTYQEGVTPDAEITALVSKYEDQVAPIINQVTGTADETITRTQNAAGESALGNLIADAQRWKMDTDFAFMNPGGIRDDIYDGEVTWGELYTVQPFNNDLVKMTLTGEQIRNLLNQQWANLNKIRMLQISGLKYTLKDNQVVDIFLADGTTQVDPAAGYTVTVNSFLADGGDGFTVLKEGTDRVIGPVDLEGLIDYIDETFTSNGLSITAAIEGRIQIAAAAESSLDLRIMGTSDLHANIVDYDYFKDAPSVTLGLARTADHIRQARAQEQNNLLLDCGDLIQGNPMGSYVAKVDPLEEGEKHPVHKALELLEYDAATLGNHEFNFGLDFLDQTLDATSIPYTTANVYIDDHDNDPTNDVNRYTPYKILNKTFIDDNGQPVSLKVGVIGFVPPQIMDWDKPNLEGKVITKDIKETAEKLVPQMKIEGADIIVALAHTGKGDDMYTPGEEDAVYQLTQVSGIDALIYGHSHKAAAESLNGVPTIQPGYWGSHLGIIDLTLEKVDGKWQVKASKTENRAIYDKTNKVPLVAAQQDVLDSVNAEHVATLDYVRQPVGETTARIHSYFSLVQDDPSIQIVTNAQKWYVENVLKGTQYEGIPVLSAGAPFKAGGSSPDYYTDVPEGTLAIKNVADLYLYDNTVYAVKLNGAQLKEWLEMSAGQFNKIDPAITDEQPLINTSFKTYNFDVIDGVSYEIDVTQPARYDADKNLVNSGANRIKNLKYNGYPVAGSQEFIVATNNYRANNPFPGCKDGDKVLKSTYENREAIVDYIKELGTINPTADNNWTFTPINGNINVTFSSSPNAEQLADEYAKISHIGEDVNGFHKYAVNLNGEVVIEKSFEILASPLDRTSGIKATVSVNRTNAADHEGSEVVIFHLMKGQTPKSIVALGKDIQSSEDLIAHFNEAGDDLWVKAFVFDEFNSDTNSVQTNLAEARILQ
jgi:2',3'-cyclic-nucleotide 2'-phosphodiesterase